MPELTNANGTIMVERESWLHVAWMLQDKNWHGSEETAALGHDIERMARIPRTEWDSGDAWLVPVDLTLTEDEMRTICKEATSHLAFRFNYARHNDTHDLWNAAARITMIAHLADNLIKGFERDRDAADGLHRPDGTI